MRFSLKNTFLCGIMILLLVIFKQSWCYLVYINQWLLINLIYSLIRNNNKLEKQCLIYLKKRF